MIHVISLAAVLLIFGLAVLVWFLWSAVDGYEDEGGFHQMSPCDIELGHVSLLSSRLWPRYFRALYNVTIPAAIGWRLAACKSLSSNRQVILRPRGKASIDSAR